MNAVLQPNMNNLELNKGDQFIIGLDISTSMTATDCPGNMSRLNYCLETTKLFVTEAAKWDPDGVSLYLFGASVHAYPDMSPADIETKLSNIKTEGSTMTHLAIDAAYKEHKTKKNEQTFLIIFTDGEPADQQAVEQSIIRITKDVKDEKEFRIELITVGQRSSGLDRWLTELDNNLTAKGAKYDILGVKKLEEVDFMSAVMNALEG